jgi:hypothetical protein
MVLLLVAAGVLEIIAGLATFASAKSAIHEILALLMVGFAFLTIALGAILRELKKAQSRVQFSGSA